MDKSSFQNDSALQLVRLKNIALTNTTAQTNANFLSANTSYYTQSQANSNFVSKTGDTMTGSLYLPYLSATTISATTISTNNYTLPNLICPLPPFATLEFAGRVKVFPDVPCIIFIMP